MNSRRSRRSCTRAVEARDYEGDRLVSNAVGAMTHHARHRYRRLFRLAGSPAAKVEAEAVHLHEVEQRGDSAATPFIAIGGLILFLLPIFLVLLGLAFAAYYLA
jgi:hypothetical protein